MQQCLIAAVHREWHGIMHVGDPPTSIIAAKACGGAGAPVPEGSQTPPSSGRPSAPLDDAACLDVWKMAAPNGETLAKDKAVPFVVNYEMVDTDKDSKISPNRNLRRVVERAGFKNRMLQL